MMGDVLVVDDDPEICDVVAYKLQRLGHRVRSTCDPREALAMLAVDPFDVVVLDWNMPHMTGVEMCALMRSVPHLAGVPVVIATAFCDGEASRTAFAAGATAFLSKPFPLGALGALVTELVRRGEGADADPATTSGRATALDPATPCGDGLVPGRGCRAGLSQRCAGPSGCAYVRWARSGSHTVKVVPSPRTEATST